MRKSDIYAKRDGIKVTYETYGIWTDRAVYHIPCSKCGDIVRKLVYQGDREYYCNICKLGIKRKREAVHDLALDHMGLRYNFG